MLKKPLIILILLFGITFTSFAQNKITPGGDLIAKRIKFYPNPATSVVSFEFQRTLDAGASLQFYNFMGKKVYETKASAPRLNISLTDFYRGVYIYQLRDKNGMILESGKFQVVK